MALLNYGTTHTRDTGHPQTYWQHFGTALRGSLRLIGLGLGGIWHAFFPEQKRFQFRTSTGVIRIYRELELSNRHDDEIGEIFSSERRRYIESHRGA